MATTTISVNRAPVLTLWAAVVAERLGFAHDEALTLGKVLAGLNAQAKGRRLGIFTPHAKDEVEQARDTPAGKTFLIDLLGRPVPATSTPRGIRATVKGRPADPASVERYLRGKFGEHFDPVRQALQRLARAYPPRELALAAYPLYEQFRPEIPAGVRGWGARGNLDLQRIARLAQQQRQSTRGQRGPRRRPA